MVRQAAIATVALFGVVLAARGLGAMEPSPADAAEPSSGSVPRAVTVARTTTIPACTLFVDAAGAGGDGSAAKPHTTIAAAVEAAQPGAVICVAEGSYPEQLKPGEKHFTLAGGFQSGKGFKVRDSAAYATKAVGQGGSFLHIEDPGPQGEQLTAIDGFEISGYSQAIHRDFYETQRFDVTNNFIHDNACADASLVGAGLALNNVTGVIKGNVFAKNVCGRGGAVFLNNTKNDSKVSIENNRIDGNSGTEPDSSHGGALYLFGHALSIVGNEFTNNSVTQWGGGLYVGAFTEGGQPTTATLAWNVYRGNRAGNSGGGFFCDDGANCTASHEIYDRNCGGNILLDGGSSGSGPTTTRFDHITNVGALGPGCDGPGVGVLIDNYQVVAPDAHVFTNAIFWGNAADGDFAVSCGTGCDALKVNVSHSLVQTKYGDGSVKIDFGAGNIAPADPLFAAPHKGDFRLKPGSPAIGKGTGGTDLGAYGKSDGTTDAPAPAATELPAPATEPSAPAATQQPPAPAVEPPAPAADSSAPAPTDDAPAEEASEAAKEPKASPAMESPAAPTGAAEVPVKEAFEAAKELGTVEAWQAFLASYPTGFHADLARAYLKKLGDTSD